MFRTKKSRRSLNPLAIIFLTSLGLFSPLVANATQVIPLTLTETVRQADAIVMGTVGAHKTRWGNDSRRWMLTDYTFEIEDVIYASGKTGPVGKTITVTYWGGTLDGETQAISDTRLPVRGERLLLMLKAGWQNAKSSPVVGLNQGLFTVTSEKAGSSALVRDANGSPLVRSDDGKMMKGTSGSNQQSSAAGVELNTFVSWLRSNIAAIKAAPSELPPKANRNDPRVMKVFSKRPASPQQRDADRAIKETGRKPATDWLHGSKSAPSTPNASRPAGFSGSEQVTSTRPPYRSGPDYSYPRTANRPIVVNNFPDSFAPWSPEDEYQMSKWNYYADDVFRVYTTPTGTWAWQNDRFDLCGWPSSADMLDQFGEAWDSNTIGICYTRWFTSDNIIIEGDIALNDENFDFTLSDEPIYDGSSLQGFRQVMTHELGHMWGLAHQFNFMSVMNYFPSEFRFFGMPYMDDAEAIRAAYPGVAVARTDLGVYLYYGNGFQDVNDATFPSSVTAGQTLTVNYYHLENVGTTTIGTPTVEWYLTSARNYGSSYYYLGTSTYPSLPRFTYFDPPSTSRTFTVPTYVTAGYYYLNAYIRDDGGTGQGSFPFSNNTAFSRTRIQVIVPPLALTSAASRKTHGSSGIFSISLPLSGEPGVECRKSGGRHTLRFIFTNNVVGGSASVTLGTGNVSGTPSFAGNTMTVDLTGVADVQKIRVRLNSVTDEFGQVLPNTPVSVNMLIGDTTGNKSVNSSDIGQTKARSGQAATGSNFRSDVTASGSINASDIGLVKTRSGASVP